MTTNPDGSISTYSWGNEANEHGWNKNQAKDMTAAKQALKDQTAKYLDDSSLDRYIEKAFDELNKKENEHRNLLITHNCKTEAQKLLELARHRRQLANR